jgi:hypothetical protein
MMQKIKSLILSITVLSTLSFAALVPAAAFATAPANLDVNSALCSGGNLDIANSGGCDKTAGDTISQKIATVINVVSVIVAAVAVVMLMIGGFRYVTSAGSQDKVKGAKDTILYAIIGLVVVALAQVVVKFVINKSTGA